MAISTRTRYAIRALVNLGRIEKSNKGKPVKIKDIAKEQGLSKRYLENLFLLLVKSGILSSVKGENGGFFFAKNPKVITLYDIFFAVESKPGPVECVYNEKICDNTNNCELRKIWVQLTQGTYDYLKSVKLDSLITKQTAEEKKSKKGPCNYKRRK